MSATTPVVDPLVSAAPGLPVGWKSFKEKVNGQVNQIDYSPKYKKEYLCKDEASFQVFTFSQTVRCNGVEQEIFAILIEKNVYPKISRGLFNSIVKDVEAESLANVGNSILQGKIKQLVEEMIL